ncbi:isochorismate synthase MenF [Methylosinus sp. Sm6]|uniref:isochorismate synthase n=1 Tax=Methylosinus sp. Sm6 TaxID=2866948 RepID=UPI001C99BE30|nr:isochorismate synthase [Methylosinus sp. Sm6]MBY6240092.1 isochorismate synthase [Methylosinus sp. Sm6]
MDAIVAERPSRDVSGHAEKPSFLFGSPHCAIEAYGVFERIRTPAVGGGRADSVLQAAVDATLARARRAGQENPIVVGAIPFDSRQPSFLFAPKTHRISAPRIATNAPEAQANVSALWFRSVPGQRGFEEAVAQAIATFRDGHASKAVLSRILEIEFSERVDAMAILEILRRQNPAGYHFHAPLPDGGVLLGASPELLIRKIGGSIRSNPLAGSAKRVADAEEDARVGRRLLQSSKDNFEHRLVIDEIRRLLAPLCAKLSIPEEPALMSTPTMWHLSSSVSGELADGRLSSLQLASLLHPTPAICGSPTAQARMLIERLEPFDRGFFAGIVGWCDEKGDGEWAIAIRCGTVNEMVVRLFAGAGIVEASDPRAEWAETEAKLGTMLRAFGVERGIAP